MKKVFFLAIVVVVTMSSCQSYRYVSQEARADEIRNQITTCQKNIERYSKAHNHGDSSAVQMIELYRHQLVQYEQALTTILSSDEERVAINTNDPYGGSVFMATAKGAGSSSVSNISADQSGECLLLLQNKFLSMSNFYNSRNTVYFTVYRVGGLTNKQERLEKWSLTDINWRRSVAVISGTLRPKENKVLELTPGNYLVEFRRSGKNYYSNAVLNPAKTMNVSHEDLVGTGYNINEINNLAAIIPK